MKKLLLATSAIVGLAGAAAAEVAVTGDGRIGLRYDSDQSYFAYNDAGALVERTRDTWNVASRARIHFTMTGETDSGLSFGATFRAEKAGQAASNGLGNQGNIWISGAYGKLSAGDVDSALENAVGDLPEVGLTGLDFYNEFGYNSSDIGAVSYVNSKGEVIVGNYQDDSTLLYEYQVGDATLYASFEDSYFGNGAVRKGKAWSVGAGYNLGNYSFGLGYEDAEYFASPLDGTVYTDVDSKTWGISGGTSISGITLKAIYVTSNIEDDSGLDEDVKQYGVGAEYAMANGVGLAGFWRKVDAGTVDLGAGPEDMDATIYGLGASYDLGGGASLKGGLVKVDSDWVTDRTIADFGVSMKF